MNRVATLFCACCITLAVGHEQTHAAPTATKAKKTVSKTSKRTRPGARPKAVGPAVSIRKGVARIGVAPKGTRFDAGFHWFFDALEVKSARSSATLGKADKRGPVQIPKVSVLTANKPDNGAMFLSAYNANWQTRGIGFLSAGIHIENPGGLAIHVPLDASLQGEDLRVECQGSFADTMTMQAAVIPSSIDWGGLGGPNNDDSEQTHTAQFGGVTTELKFLLEVPTTSISSPMLNILIEAGSTKTWSVQQCSIDRI